MAVTQRSSFGQSLHFLLRFLGLNGLVALAVGAFLWLSLDLQFAGMIVMIAGAAAVCLALMGEMRGMAQATFSHRGVAGVNVLLQIGMATALLIGGNVFAFNQFKRFDVTTERTFTLEDGIRQKLATMRGDTDIIVYL